MEEIILENQSITGFYIGGYFRRMPDLVKAEIAELVRLAGQGRLKLPVGTVLPHPRAVEAHQLLEGRKTTGKMVLEPWAI